MAYDHEMNQKHQQWLQEQAAQAARGATLVRDTTDAACIAPTAWHEIGWAVKQMWNGLAVCRRGWNGQNMSLRIQYPDLNSKMTQPYVYMKTADGGLMPWLCSQSDLLATDWQLYEAP